MLDILTDPARMIVIASVVGTFLTILAFILPYVRSDPLAARLKSATKRRHELRAQQMEALQQKSKLRRSRTSPLWVIVDKLNLRELFAAEELRGKLIQANWRDPNAVAIFVSARALAPIVFGVAAVAFLWLPAHPPVKPQLRPLALFAAVAAGLYLPNLMVQNAINKRQASITSGFPDALDLLLICVESGLSIEAAFGRVAQEIGESYPELAEEFELTTAELAYLPDRRVAIENLVSRTGLPSVKAVGTTLVQAEKYGTPLTAALRNAAQENREARLAAAEKKAASLPATLTVPMIVFFLPVLFLVILGPAVIQFMTR